MFERGKDKISSYILDKQNVNFQYKEINKIVDTLNNLKDDKNSNIKPSEHLDKIAVLSDTHGSLISLIGSLLDAGIITKLKKPEFVYDLFHNKYRSIKEFNNNNTYTTAKLYCNINSLELTKDRQDCQNPLSRFIVIPGFKINEDYKGQVIHLGDILDRGRENYHSLLFLKKLKQELIKLDNSNNNEKDNSDNNKKDNPKYSDKLILLCGNHEISNRVSDDIFTRLSFKDLPYLCARDNIVKDMTKNKEMNLIYDYKTKTKNNNRVIFSHAFNTNTIESDNITKFIKDIKDLIDKYKQNKEKSIMDNLNFLLKESELLLEESQKKEKELELLSKRYKEVVKDKGKTERLIKRYKEAKRGYEYKLTELYTKYYELNFKLLQTLDVSFILGKRESCFDYRNIWGLPSGLSFLNIVGHKPNICFKYENNLIHVDVYRNTDYCNLNKKDNKEYKGKISTLYLDDNIINEIIKYKKTGKDENNINNLLSKNNNTIEYTIKVNRTNNNEYDEILVNNENYLFKSKKTINIANKQTIHNKNIQQENKQIDNTNNKSNQIIMNNGSAITFGEDEFKKLDNINNQITTNNVLTFSFATKNDFKELNNDIKNINSIKTKEPNKLNTEITIQQPSEQIFNTNDNTFNQPKNTNNNSVNNYVDISQNLIKSNHFTNNITKKIINKATIQSDNKDNKNNQIITNIPPTVIFHNKYIREIVDKSNKLNTGITIQQPSKQIVSTNNNEFNQPKNINTNLVNNYVNSKQIPINISPVANNSTKKIINKPIIQSDNNNNQIITNDLLGLTFGENNKKEGSRLDYIIRRKLNLLQDKSNQKSSKTNIDFENKKIQKESKSSKIDIAKNNNLNSINTNNKKIIHNRSKVLDNNQYNLISKKQIQPFFREDNRIYISNNRQEKLPKIGTKLNMNQPITITNTNIKPKNKDSIKLKLISGKKVKSNINKPIIKYNTKLNYMKSTESTVNRNKIIRRESLNKRPQENQNQLQRN